MKSLILVATITLSAIAQAKSLNSASNDFAAQVQSGLKQASNDAPVEPKAPCPFAKRNNNQGIKSPIWQKSTAYYPPHMLASNYKPTQGGKGSSKATSGYDNSAFNNGIK